MSIKLVDRHSANRAGRTEAGIFCTKHRIEQTTDVGDAMIWVRDDPHAPNREFALSTGFDWEICPNDNGWITIRAYKKVPRPEDRV